MFFVLQFTTIISKDKYNQPGNIDTRQYLRCACFEMERFFYNLRRRSTESGKNQRENKEPVSSEVKRASWPLLSMEPKTKPVVAKERLHRLSNDEQQYRLPAISDTATQLKPAVVDQEQKSRVYYTSEDTKDMIRPAGSHYWYLKPIISSSCNSGSRAELLARKYECLVELGEELVSRGVLQHGYSSMFAFPGAGSGPQRCEFPALVEKMYMVKNQQPQSDGDHSNFRQKAAKRVMYHDYEAAKLESWQRFYSKNAIMDTIHKEIDEYLSDLMFQRLLKETEVAATSQPAEYRTETAVTHCWESVRAALNFSLDNEDKV